MQIWLVLGGVNGAIAVTAAAIGTHALKTGVSAQQFDWFSMAARFHLVHAIVLLIAATLRIAGLRSVLIDWSAGSLQGGIVLFCGTLYWLGLNGPGSLGPLHVLTPLGGGLLIAGWTLLAVVGARGLT